MKLPDRRQFKSDPGVLQALVSRSRNASAVSDAPHNEVDRQVREVVRGTSDTDCLKEGARRETLWNPEVRMSPRGLLTLRRSS